MRALNVLFLASLLGLTQAGEAQATISGTYVARGANYAEMLQLTETGGQVNGILSDVTLRPDGHIDSEQGSVTGTVADNTITLTLHAGPLGLFPSSVAGTVNTDTIELQQLGSNGNVSEWKFVRGSTSTFQEAAAPLKARGQAIVFSANLVKETNRAEQNVRAVEAWITAANTHLQRIPGAKGQIQKLSGQMQSLVARERTTRGDVARSQLSVAVSQGDVTGDQVDIQVDQVWDQVTAGGQQIGRIFQSYHLGCGEPEALEARGATPPVVQHWESACGSLMSSQAKFDPVFKRVLQERAELKTFQAGEKQKRSVLVQQASQLE